MRCADGSCARAGESSDATVTATFRFTREVTISIWLVGHAHAVGLAQQVFQVGRHFLGKNSPSVRSGLARGGFEMQQALHGAIHVHDLVRRIERQHAGGNALQDGFDVAVPLLESER